MAGIRIWKMRRAFGFCIIKLVKSNYAFTYFLIFNEFRRERIEFIKTHYVDFIQRKSQVERRINFNQSTISNDFEVLRKLYFSNKEDKNIEDGFAGLLTSLGMVSVIQREKDDSAISTQKGRERYEAFFINNTERSALHKEAMLFSILDNPNHGKSLD